MKAKKKGNCLNKKLIKLDKMKKIGICFRKLFYIFFKKIVKKY